MSTKLKRIVEVLAVAALLVAVLAVLPGRAEAQGMASTQAARGIDRVVVAPGDSLWSISQELLGPQATPPRVYREVERIYALNRNLIGPDPNLIFPGQKLLLPPTAGEPASKPASARATLPREAAGAARPLRPARATEGGAEQVARTTVVAGRKMAPDRVVEAPNLPEAVEVPAAGRPAVDPTSRSPVASLLEHASSTFASALGETFAQIRNTTGGRLLLVVGIWLLTFALVVLMVWMLPVRRTTRFEAERWGIPTGYGTPGREETSLVPSGMRRRSRPSPGRSPARAGGETGSGDQTGDAITPKRRRTGPARAPNGRPSPSGGLALGAHNGRVRRAVLRARTQMRARKARAARSGEDKRSGSRLRTGSRSRPNERGAHQR